jgi:molecular chaperone GrpE (heat shock protein)
MAFFDSFWRKVKYYTDTSAQNAVSGINEALAETNERLRRIETRQKETSIQLEEIDELLQNSDNETAFVDALIALADTIGDFYFFTAADQSSPLFEQAQMMWNRARSAVEAVGLEIIDASDEPFDFRLHSAEGAEQNPDIPNGYVIKTMKSGYIYQEKVIRRAAVIINKIEKVDEIEQVEKGQEIEEADDKPDEKNEPPHIIYL